MGGPIQGNGGFYGAITQQYSKVGNSGMSRSEFRDYYMQQSQQHSEVFKQQNCMKNIAQIQNAAGMMGMKLDAGSVFAMADTNGDGYISNKEASAMMGRLGTMAQLNAMNGNTGAQSSSGNSNVFGMLNSIGEAVGGLAGGEQGGGGFLEKAGTFLGGLFG